MTGMCLTCSLAGNLLKKKLGLKKNGVLVPSDNVSDIKVDELIKKFISEYVELVFSITKIDDVPKLSQMGVYDLDMKKFSYKPKKPASKYGVIAPYIISNKLNCVDGENVLNHKNSSFLKCSSFWFDIGDIESLLNASIYISKRKI